MLNLQLVTDENHHPTQLIRQDPEPVENVPKSVRPPGIPTSERAPNRRSKRPEEDALT